MRESAEGQGLDTIIEYAGVLAYSAAAIAPFVLLWWGVRRYRSWSARRTEAANRLAREARVVLPASPDSGAGSPAPKTTYSFDIGNALIYGMLLLFAVGGMRHWWSLVFHAAYWAFLVGFARLGLSRREHARICAAYPGTSYENWVFNYGLFFVGLPLIAWLVFGVPALATTVGTLRGR